MDARYGITYGKAKVPVYRVHATPLRVAPIPESPFTGRGNTLLAAEIDVDVLGDDFLPAYTAGDNRMVVATDSMKNFVLRESLAYDGPTLEGLLAFLGGRFVATYSQLRTLRLSARELPFLAARVPADRTDHVPGGPFADSAVLFSRSHDDATVATIEIEGDADSTTVTGHRCGRVGIQLLKVTGSAFTAFVRDDYTTLPDRRDRPLFVHLDVHWRYADVADLLAPDTARYVAPEQVRDLVATVFHEFVSESIQHLVHEMGTRLLARFSHLAEVSFAAQNHTPDPAATSDTSPDRKVYTAPFPAHGLITLGLRRTPTPT